MYEIGGGEGGGNELGFEIEAASGQAEAINEISRYLAERELPSMSTERAVRLADGPADLLILLGNGLPYVMEQAAEAFRAGVAKRFMIVGGIGHSTNDLIRRLRAHPRYRDIGTDGKSEAEMLLEAADVHAGIDPGGVLLETESTNCGNNAANAFELLNRQGGLPGTAILMQDPTMQRRSGASFRRAWRESGHAGTRFYSYAAFVPQVEMLDGRLRFDRDTRTAGPLWEMSRFLSLILGEVRRLNDDENGYGPRGRDYIDHVEVPDRVMEAYRALLPAFSAYVRTESGGNV